MVFEQIDFFLESIYSIIVMKLLRLLSPLPGPVGAVVVSLEANWRDSIGWDPELLQCERGEVCHATELSLPPLLAVLLSSHMCWAATQVSHYHSLPPLHY